MKKAHPWGKHPWSNQQPSKDCSNPACQQPNPPPFCQGCGVVPINQGIIPLSIITLALIIIFRKKLFKTPTQ